MRKQSFVIETCKTLTKFEIVSTFANEDIFEKTSRKPRTRTTTAAFAFVNGIIHDVIFA